MPTPNRRAASLLQEKVILFPNCYSICESFSINVLLFSRLFEVQTDFTEYQRSSAELEHELDSHLTQKDKKIQDLEARSAFVTSENELLKNKLEKVTNTSRQQIETLTTRLAEVTEHNQQLTTHIRELEQSNDDLERAKRHLDATLADFDSKLNEQIERNELLESEIGEKEEMQTVIQRLKDEARDLRQELMIQQNVKPKKMSMSNDETKQADTSITSPTKSKPLINGTTVKDNKSSLNSPTSPVSKSVLITPTTPTGSSSNGPIPLLSASSRISALNIVSELLRKVGALESKLASCRNIIPVSPASGNVYLPSKQIAAAASTSNSLINREVINATIADTT